MICMLTFYWNDLILFGNTWQQALIMDTSMEAAGDTEKLYIYYEVVTLQIGEQQQ